MFCQLKSGYHFDDVNIPSAGSRGKLRQMIESNKQIARLNESVPVKNVFVFKEKVSGLQRSVQQLKRETDLEEDITAEEFIGLVMLVDAQADLGDSQKRLESSRESDTRYNSTNLQRV